MIIRNCWTCKHLFWDSKLLACEAFPDGIPIQIAENGHDEFLGDEKYERILRLLEDS